MIWLILRHFVNTFSAADNYSLLNGGILTEPIHMQLPCKRETFSGIFFAFLKSILKFDHFQKNMNLIPDVFWKLQTPKNVVG